MAIITCSECNKEVSDNASVCPNCGNPINSSASDPQSSQEEYLCCPKCNSKELRTENKDFSEYNTLSGSASTETIGSSNVETTCLKCGNKFKADEAIIKRDANNGGEYGFDEELKDILEKEGMLTALHFFKRKTNLDLASSKRALESFISKNEIKVGSKSTNKGGCFSVVMISLFVTVVSLFWFGCS